VAALGLFVISLTPLAALFNKQKQYQGSADP